MIVPYQVDFLPDLLCIAGLLLHYIFVTAPGLHVFSARCITLHLLTLGGGWQGMPLFAAGADGGAGTIMSTLGVALALVPKFNGSNISLSELEERLESTACLYQVPTWLNTELAINCLKDDASRAVMVLLEEVWASLKQNVVCLEGLFIENVMLTKRGQKPHPLYGSTPEPV